MRPILLVDVSTTRFDSRSILGVVLVGDDRLPDKLRGEERVRSAAACARA